MNKNKDTLALTQNSDDQHNQVKNRRSLLKGLVAGSTVVTGSKALPETWTKPLTDAVILPSHAITTVGDFVKGDYGDEPEETGDDDQTQSNPDGYGQGGT